MSRICADLDEDVAAFGDRPLADSTYPHVFLDVTYCKARVGRRVVSEAVIDYPHVFLDVTYCKARVGRRVVSEAVIDATIGPAVLGTCVGTFRMKCTRGQLGSVISFRAANVSSIHR